LRKIQTNFGFQSVPAKIGLNKQEIKV